MSDQTIIDELINQLGSEDADTRRRAAYTLGQFATAPVVDALTTALERETDAITHLVIVGALGQMNDERAIEATISAIQQQYERVDLIMPGLLTQRSLTDTLLPLIGDEALKQRLEATSARGTSNNKETLKRLLDELESTHGQTSLLAAQALGNLGDRRAVAPLSKALKHHDQRVAQAAAMSLGRLGDEQAIAPLMKVLQDKRSPARGEAMAALTQLMGKQIIPTLLNMAEQEPSYRGEVAYLLQGFAIPSFMPLLNILTGESDASTMPPAYSMAGMPYGATPPDMQREDTLPRTPTAIAVGEYEFVVFADHYAFNIQDRDAEFDGGAEGWDYDNRLSHYPSQLYVHTARYGGPTTLLIKLLSAPPSLDLSAWQHAISLPLAIPSGQLCVDNGGEMGGEPQYISTPAGNYAGYLLYGDLDSCTDSDTDISDEHYCLVLWPSNDKIEFEVVKRWDESTLDARHEDVDKWLNILRNGDNGMRIHAIRILSQLADPTALPLLIETAANPNPCVRCAIASALPPFGEPAVATLNTLLGDNDEHVRERAALALEQMGNTQAIAPLAMMAASETALGVKWAAISALSSFDAAALPELTTLLQSSDWQVRDAASAAIAKMGVTQAVHSLSQLLTRSNEATRYMAAWTLGQIGDSRALPALEQAQRTDNGVTSWGAQVRTAAAAAIQQIKRNR